MPTKRRTTLAPIIPARDEAATENPQVSEVHHAENPHRPHGLPQATIAVAFAVLLLVLATTSQGAFAISRWAPLTLFTLAALIGALLARGGIAYRSRPVYVTLGAIWALAVWSLLSMLWAKSAGNAFEAGDRMILYAAIATLPFAFPVSRRSLAAAGWSISIGIGAVALYVLIRLLIDGSPLFLAGRLNGPVNYRNATALLFALPFWPLIVAAATRSYRRGLRASAFAVATLCLGLAFLTQSRGIVLGLAVGALVALTLGPDRVRRAWVAGLSVAGVAVAAPVLLRPYHAFTAGKLVTAHDIAVAAQALTILTVAAFGVGLLLALFDQGLRANSPQMRHVSQAARIGLAVVALVAVVGGLAAIGNPVTFARTKWDQFTSLNANSNPSSTRLASVGGQRYDLWRVAVKEWESAPILGVGSDNYEFGYYRDRKTNRNLDDPHSLLFAVLSENGIVGVALLFAFLGGIAAVIRRGWPTMSQAERRHVIGPAAAGAVLMGQSAVDWIWLIPGLTAVGIFALSVAAAQAAASPDAQALLAEEAEGGRTRSRLAGLGRPAAVGALVVAVAGVLALFLSDAYIQRARTLEDNPSRELPAAQMAAIFDPWSVTPHYLQSSAYESMGERAKAFHQLNDALALEPQNSATLGVLGDFEVRGGNYAAARGYYQRALDLNPLDTGLQQLARIGLGRRGASRSST
jgi:O-Antigen ligase